MLYLMLDLSFDIFILSFTLMDSFSTMSFILKIKMELSYNKSLSVFICLLKNNLALLNLE